VLAHAAYHDYEGLAMNLDERARIVRDLGEKNVPILRNHGLLTVGRTIGEAIMRMARAGLAASARPRRPFLQGLNPRK